PGSTFAVGTTAVTYTATDAAGNISLTCSFDVTVTDDEAPVLSGCPSNINQSNDAGECSAVVSWTEPTALDNCTAPGSLVWSKSHTPGSTFAVGTTAVTYTATDAAGNISLTCSFDVTVTDDEAPVLSGCPSNISQSNDAGECSAVVSWTEPTASDNCTAPGSLVWSKSHTPGSTFAVGTTAVTYTATDAAGNISLTCSFDVTVTDDEAPVLSGCPSNISQSNDAGECSAVVSWTEPTASDNCTAPGSLVWSKSHTPGSTFAVGTTAVTYTATDAAGNISLTCSFDVTVTDDEAPTITCGNTIEKTIQSNASCTSYIEVPVPEVNDNCGIASIENNINGASDASGDYPEGETVIEWMVTDYGGNSKTCEQLIIVYAIPSAFDDVAITAEDTPTTIAVVANDVDCDNNIDLNTLTITSGPAHGNVNITSNGRINYTPDKNYAGTDFFSYRICDEDEQCDEANVTITVRSQNDPPVAVDDLNNTFVDTNVGGNVLTNDYDIDGNSLSVAIAGNPSHGSVMLNSNGDYTYSPAAGYLGEDHFSYQLRDGHGGTSTAEVFITIISDHAMSNQPPVANEDVYVGKMNTSIIGNVLKNDYDPDGDPLTLNTNLVAQPSEGTIQINADGSFIYSPKTNYSGQISFTYQVCDDGEPLQCNTAQVILIIDRNSNDNSTVAVDDAFFTKVNNTLTANVVGNDYDPEGHSTTVSLIGQALHGDVVLNANGGFSYTPDTDYIGPDHFTYRSCDQGSPTACDQATVYINVSEVNHPPVAVDDWFGRDGAAANILLNDYDPDGDELVLNTTPVVSVQHGTLIINADGSFSYTPEQLYFEQDSFTYQVCDNALVPLCDEATVIIYVDSDNDGVANVFDIDDDNDGILDIVEGDKAVDTDNDGVPDSLDIDSDNDGIPDNLESQHAEDYVAPSGADADGDGWDDAYDNDNGGTPIVIVDTDGDGIGDYLDVDSDNDGIIDAIEGNDSNHDGVADSIATGVDSDGDGLDDAYDTVNNKSSTATNALGSNVIMGNSDGDEVPDWRDIDSDNDGIVDSVEGQDSQLAYVAPTGNDSDGDGLDDAYDPDVGGIQVGVVDTDSDGIPDYLDEDSDNDLVPDFVEGQDLNKDGQPDHEFMGLDADGDGLDNSNDTSDDITRLENPMGTNVPLADSDGDGIPDWRDTDDDGDGLQTASKEDWNEDGDPTNDDCNYNGIPNYLDEESCDLLIPDAFSPNGDGINDHFRIRGMYKYPNAKIEIYNRWGAVVYTKENYGNITMYGDPDAWWDGRANSKGTSGSEILPTGTYFVVLILENSFVHKGIVYINR
ncbi:Ig-like domain-containing protein, partial [Sunxiuqinia elliptica]